MTTLRHGAPYDREGDEMPVAGERTMMYMGSMVAAFAVGCGNDMGLVAWRERNGEEELVGVGDPARPRASIQPGTQADTGTDADTDTDDTDAEVDLAGCEVVVPRDTAEIQTALDEASDGDTICVRAGVYDGDLLISKDVRLIGVDGREVTILRGTGTDAVVRFSDGLKGAGGVTSAALLQGFTITGGHVDLDDWGGGDGGGIFVSACDPTLADLVVTGNLADSEAGGLYLRYSASVIERVVIVGNEAIAGGGVSLIESPALLRNVQILGNRSAGGGGVALWGSAATFQNVVIAGNSADTYAGGGMSMSSNDVAPTFSNVTIHGNTTLGDGGGMYLDLRDEPGTFNNVIMSGNRAGGLGGAIAAAGSQSQNPDISHGVAWDNGTNPLAGTTLAPEAVVEFDPTYVDSTSPDPMDWDLRLGKGSACVDLGDPGLADPDGSVSDPGAYGGPGGASW